MERVRRNRSSKRVCVHLEPLLLPQCRGRLAFLKCAVGELTFSFVLSNTSACMFGGTGRTLAACCLVVHVLNVLTRRDAAKPAMLVGPLEVAGSREFSFRTPIPLLACVLGVFGGRQRQ